MSNREPPFVERRKSVASTIKLMQAKTRDTLIGAMGMSLVVAFLLMSFSFAAVFVYVSIQKGEMVGVEAVTKIIESFTHVFSIAIGLEK